VRDALTVHMSVSGMEGANLDGDQTSVLIDGKDPGLRHTLELRFQRFHAHRTLSHVRRFDSCAIEPQAQAIQPGGY